MSVEAAKVVVVISLHSCSDESGWQAESLSDFLYQEKANINDKRSRLCQGDQMVRLFLIIWPFATMKISPMTSLI